MCPVSEDTCTEVHFETCSIWQLRLNHNNRIETVACKNVPSLELLATCPCTKDLTVRYVTWNYYAVEYRTLEQTLLRAAHVCLFVWTDMTTNRDEGRHLFCCYLTTLLRTGWAGRLLPRYLFLTPCPPLSSCGRQMRLTQNTGRVSLCALYLNPSWKLHQRGSDRKNMPHAWATEKCTQNIPWGT
jgi:hypothetical protein